MCRAWRFGWRCALSHQCPRFAPFYQTPSHSLRTHPIPLSILIGSPRTLSPCGVRASHATQGDLDLITGSKLPEGASQGGVRIYLNPSGSMGRYFRDVVPLELSGVTGQDTAAIVLADLNGDQRPDLVVGNSGAGQANYFYINPGNGRFDQVAGVAVDDADLHLTQALAVTDFNHDNVMDIVVGNRGQPNRIYFGTLSGSTYSIASAAVIGVDNDDTYAVAFGDLNLDTFPDLVVGNYEQENKANSSKASHAYSPLHACSRLPRASVAVIHSCSCSIHPIESCCEQVPRRFAQQLSVRKHA